MHGKKIKTSIDFFYGVKKHKGSTKNFWYHASFSFCSEISMTRAPKLTLIIKVIM